MRNGRVRDPIVVILLSLCTCGLYALVWYYEVSCEIQDALNRRDTAPGLEVLLIVLTGGLYAIYWWYKYGRMVSEIQAARGMPVRDNAVVLAVLSAVCFWAGWMDVANMAILQSDLNNAWQPGPIIV